jgi:porphobilinogen synthase
MLGQPQFKRLRRLRSHALMRRMLQDVVLRPEDLVYPIFVRPGKKIRATVPSMPGVHQFSPDSALAELQALEQTGVKSFILFGVTEPRRKDPKGSDAHDPQNAVCKTLELVRKKNLDLYAMTDLCFCSSTSHGHCGILSRNEREVVDNDATIDRLGEQALVHARAGADLVAPSGMMDGAVAAIRKALDSNQFKHLPIMSYAVKYASAFYGPFRDAAQSAPGFGDRKTYQMDPLRQREALQEAEADLEQGADILMVKPGLPYLDILRDLREKFDAPLAAYHVSGEYAMIKAAARQGWVDETAVVLESLAALKRAGASLILTYFARSIAPKLRA